MEITNFLVGKEKSLRTAINMTKISDRESQITVVAQILELGQSTDESDAAAWQWSKRYVQLRTDTSSQLITRNQFVIEFSPTLLHPLGPVMIQRAVIPGIESIHSCISWQLTSDQLIAALASTWGMLNPDSDEIIGNVTQLPTIVNPTAIPYCDRCGDEKFFVEVLPPSLIPKPKAGPKEKVVCCICGTEKTVQKM